MATKLMDNAKRNKADEFYTQLADIEKELRHYKDCFRERSFGKRKLQGHDIRINSVDSVDNSFRCRSLHVHQCQSSRQTFESVCEMCSVRSVDNLQCLVIRSYATCK